MKGSSAEAAARPYLEIDLRFAAAATAGRVQMTVETPAGASGWQEIDLPLGGAEAERLAHRALLGASRRGAGDEPARRLGRALFESLFARQALGRFHATLGPTRAGGPGLRLRFHLGSASAEEAALHRLPWELLCEPGTGDGRLLALDRRLSVVRHLTIPDGVAMPPRSPRLRVLVAVAEGRAPGDDPRFRGLDLGGEVDAIGASCRAEGVVTVEVVRSATVERLIERLRGGGFHVLHLSGHGDLAGGDGVVLLPDAAGRLVPWHGERLAEQLDGLSPLRLVVLNACRTAEAVAGRPFAGVAGAFLARGLPAAVAMQAPITDLAAAAFATALYGRLAAGDGLDAAVSEGRLAISGKRPHTFEWAVPVLFSRLPGGELFAEPAGEGATASARRSVAAGAPVSRRALLAVLSLAVLVAAGFAGFAGLRLSVEEPAPGGLAEGPISAERSPADAGHDELLANLAQLLRMGADDGEAEPEPSAADARRADARSMDGGGRKPDPAPPEPGGPPDAGAGRTVAGGQPIDPASGRNAKEPAPAAAAPFCGPIRTLESGEPVEVPELGASLVPRVLDHPGLGAYVTLALLGTHGSTHRSTVGPEVLDFRNDAPLVVRVLAFDPAAGTVRLSCKLVH